MKRLFLIVSVLFLTACAGSKTAEPEAAAVAATAVPQATLPPTDVPAPAEPTAVPTTGSEETAVATASEPTPTEAMVDEGPQVVSGRLEEGAFFYGDPDAPITMIDYSDFL